MQSNPAFRKHESSALKACFIYIEAPVSDSSSRMSKVDKERELNIFREKESNHAFLLFCFPAFRKQESSALKVCFIYIEAPVSDSSSRTSKVDKERELNILR